MPSLLRIPLYEMTNKATTVLSRGELEEHALYFWAAFNNYVNDLLICTFSTFLITILCLRKWKENAHKPKRRLENGPTKVFHSNIYFLAGMSKAYLKQVCAHNF